MQSQAKFSLDRAQECVNWIEAVLEKSVCDGDLTDPADFQVALKDGSVLCE